jgi:hypothetical protein
MKKLRVHNAIASSAQGLEYPLSNEILDLARNNFANGAQLLGEALLRHADRDAVSTSRALEAIGKKLSESALHTPGAFVESLDQSTNAKCETAIDQETDLRALRDRSFEGRPIEQRASRRFGGDAGCGMSLARKQRDFAHRSANAFRVYDVLSSAGLADDAHASLQDHVPTARRASGEKDDRTGRILDLDGSFRQRGNQLGRGIAKQREGSQSFRKDAHRSVSDWCDFSRFQA